MQEALELSYAQIACSESILYEFIFIIMALATLISVWTYRALGSDNGYLPGRSGAAYLSGAGGDGEGLAVSCRQFRGGRA